MTYNPDNFCKDIIKPYHKNLTVGNLITPNKFFAAKEKHQGAIYAIAFAPLYDDEFDRIDYSDGFSTSIINRNAMPIITACDHTFRHLIGLDVPCVDEQDDNGYYKKYWEEYRIIDYFSERWNARPKLSDFNNTVQNFIDKKLLIPCITTVPADYQPNINPRTDLTGRLYASPLQSYELPSGTPILVWNTSGVVAITESCNDSLGGICKAWGGNHEINGP